MIKKTCFKLKFPNVIAIDDFAISARCMGDEDFGRKGYLTTVGNDIQLIQLSKLELEDSFWLKTNEYLLS